jgi:hypothetical protein
MSADIVKAIEQNDREILAKLSTMEDIHKLKGL